MAGSRGRHPAARWLQARLPPIWDTQTVTLRAIIKIENMRTGWIWWSQAVVHTQGVPEQGSALRRSGRPGGGARVGHR